MTIEVGFRSGSSCDDVDRPYRQDRPLTIRCRSLRPITMRSNIVVRIVLSSGSSYDDEVSESASSDNEVSGSDDEVEFLQIIE